MIDSTLDSKRFARLREMLGSAAQTAPALSEQLRGGDAASILGRAELARLPLRRKSELKELQAGAPPFGGLAAKPPGKFKRLLVSPGPIFEPEAEGADWWGAAPAMRAAGFRAGEIVLNCFSYHLTPGGHIMESGAHAVGCAVIPGGTGAAEQQLDAIHHLRPDAYCGTPDFLKILLDKAQETGRDMSSIRKALVSGAALPATLRAELERRGIVTNQAFASAELGVVAYETRDAAGALEPGMRIGEDVIVEIVVPGSGDPAPLGRVGEIVATRLNADYPLLRFATGDLSAFVPEGDDPRARLKGWLGRADQTTKIRGMFVHPSQVAEIARRHPQLGVLRLVVGRRDEQDTLLLRAEAAGAASLEEIAGTIRDVTKLRGEVELVAPGSLPNDGKVIADERPIG